MSPADASNGQLQNGTINNGTYSIAASGQGFLSSPLFKGDSIYGLVNAQGIFVGSSTENQNGYNDMFIAAPLAATPPTVSTFKGPYSMAYIDLSSGNPLYTLGAMVQMNPDGNGNTGTVSIAGYVGQTGSAKTTQSLSSAKVIFSNGAGVVTFPNSNTALLTGQYYLYFSPDGNFVFGGSPGGFDMFVGVRTGVGTPSLGGGRRLVAPRLQAGQGFGAEVRGGKAGIYDRGFHDLPLSAAFHLRRNLASGGAPDRVRMRGLETSA